MDHGNAGPVLVIDHDRLFKDLLTLFFVEFLELFFPQLAAEIDRGSIDFLPEELFTGLAEGDKFVVDVLAKVRWKKPGQGSTFFVIHIEHQSTAPPDFLGRFFRYHMAAWNKYAMPVYPIVLYTHDKPRRKLPNVYRTCFPDGEVLRFTCRSVQLNRLSWRQFARSNNPLAGALMTKMKIAPKEATFMRTVEQSELKPREKARIAEYASSWDRGMAEGRQQGLEQGTLDTLRAVLLDVLSTRFGEVPASVRNRVQRLESIDELRTLTHRALTAAALSDLGLSSPRRSGGLRP
ncbi:MAG: Rpn family recombination-promoting nuclease/putative transposase [Bryobacterales bacterium]|nr:Rpn family recombination-promoting nuclease/putative transposase [Bryobacterales bacterium]